MIHIILTIFSFKVRKCPFVCQPSSKGSRPPMPDVSALWNKPPLSMISSFRLFKVEQKFKGL